MIDGEAENLGVSAFDWPGKLLCKVRSEHFEILPPTT